MLRRIFAKLWPKPRKSQVIETNSLCKTLRAVTDSLNRTSEVLRDGPHEIVEQADGFCCIKRDPLSGFQLGEMFWKISTDETYEYYTAHTALLNGKSYSARGRNPINRELLDGLIARKTVVHIGETFFKHPMRILGD